MKFRQRFAWIGVICYLGASFGVLYYFFEVNEHYNKHGLEHVQRYKSKSDIISKEEPGKEILQENTKSWMWQSLISVPTSVWFVILLIPYLQIFGFVLACTKAEPKLSFAFIWPGVLYLKYRQFVERCCGTPKKAVNSTMYSNGYVVLET